MIVKTRTVEMPGKDPQEADWLDVGYLMMEFPNITSPVPIITIRFVESSLGFACGVGEARDFAAALLAMADQAESHGQTRQ